jgi:hypothetical protein
MFVDRSMITPIENIDNYVKALHILINKMTTIESINESVKVVEKKLEKPREGTDTVYDDPLFLVNLILEDSRKNKYLIDSFVFQSVILHNQLCNNLEKYGINVKTGKSDYFKNQILNVINICETYNTCIEYSKLLREEYELLNIKKEKLFENTDYLNQFDLKIN